MPRGDQTIDRVAEASLPSPAETDLAENDLCLGKPDITQNLA